MPTELAHAFYPVNWQKTLSIYIMPCYRLDAILSEKYVLNDSLMNGNILLAYLKNIQ